MDNHHPDGDEEGDERTMASCFSSDNGTSEEFVVEDERDR